MESLHIIIIIFGSSGTFTPLYNLLMSHFGDLSLSRGRKTLSSHDQRPGSKCQTIRIDGWLAKEV